MENNYRKFYKWIIFIKDNGIFIKETWRTRQGSKFLLYVLNHLKIYEAKLVKVIYLRKDLCESLIKNELKEIYGIEKQN